MKIKYFRGMWGMSLPTLTANLEAIRAAGFDGVEMGAPREAQERQQLRALLDDLGLDLVVQQWTSGNSSAAHAASFEEQYLRGIELRPLFINSHTGVDHYTLADNLPIFDHASALADRYGVLVLHETHRGRPTFSAPATVALLEARPELKLTADFSHWCCVHESLLKDQAQRVQRAIEHTLYVHARVGHPEGPQVSDPRAPEWQEAVEVHLAWWQEIVIQRHQAGAETLCLCPEFGPPDYMVRLPYTRQPVADLWEINLYMKEYLQQNLLIP